MANDAQRARDELAAEADRLAAKHRADEEGRRHAAVSREQNAKIVRPGHLRAALYRSLFLLIGAALIFVASLMLFVASAAVPGDVLTRNEAIVSSAIGLAGVGLIALRFTSIGRSRRWRATLPFQVQGFEQTLGIGQLVSILAVKVTTRTPIETSVLVELMRDRLPESELLLGSKYFEIRSPRFSESSNARGVSWFRSLVRSLLLDIHRGYPIETVIISAHETTEFWMPSGDP